MSKGSTLALLVAALAAVTGYIGISREPPSSPAPHSSEGAKGPGHIAVRAENGRRSPDPETTTIVILPRPTQREMAVWPPRSYVGDPVGLARALQRELQRVGCYFQEINGEWSPATRRAAKDFTDRVNAVLPLNAPDPILLALLQSERKVVCGGTCPTGQDLTKDNRCLPSALLALSSPQQAALLERANIRKSTGETDTSAPPPATPIATSVPSAYRTRRRPTNSGSWLFGLFGW